MRQVPYGEAGARGPRTVTVPATRYVSAGGIRGMRGGLGACAFQIRSPSFPKNARARGGEEPVPGATPYYTALYLSSIRLISAGRASLSPSRPELPLRGIVRETLRLFPLLGRVARRTCTYWARFLWHRFPSLLLDGLNSLYESV